jgi:hypothetical protein
MLDNRVFTFSQFILERADRDLGSYYLTKLSQIQDTEVIGKLEELSNAMNELENLYWYSRDGGKAHYALNMKIQVYPDLEEWAKARGEEDLDDVNDEMMADDWYRYMEDTYAVHVEDYKESFSWVKEVGVGGASGGWLLIYPKATHDDIENDSYHQIEDYLDYAESALELVPDLINSPDETNRLAELGLIEDDVLDNAKTAMKWRLALLKWIDEELTKLAEVKEDLATITREIENFRKNAETYFYEWVREVYVYPQYK